MIDVFSPKNTRVRIRKVAEDSIEIRTPYMNGNREFLRYYTVGAEWDGFSGCWTAVCPDSEIRRLGLALKVRFHSAVAIEEGGDIPLSPTAPLIAPEKKVEIL